MASFSGGFLTFQSHIPKSLAGEGPENDLSYARVSAVSGMGYVCPIYHHLHAFWDPIPTLLCTKHSNPLKSWTWNSSLVVYHLYCINHAILSSADSYSCHSERLVKRKTHDVPGKNHVLMAHTTHISLLKLFSNCYTPFFGIQQYNGARNWACVWSVWTHSQKPADIHKL